MADRGENISYITHQEQMTKLLDDLHQTRVDKDFIWSLWKRLQVAKPDVTAAISDVVQRETTKSEIKDRKVLGILQIKDRRISDLELTVTTQSDDITSLVTIKSEVEDKLGKQENENRLLLDKISSLECRLLSWTSEETTKDECNRKLIEKLDSDKSDLQRRLTQVLNELQSEKHEREREVHRNDTLQNVISTLENDISKKVDRFQGVISELETSRKQVGEFERATTKNQLELDEKTRELEVVRGELSELWRSHHELNDHATQQAELIHQLHGLQSHTQNIMKSQEDAYSHESTSLQKMYDELNKRYEHTKKREIQMSDKIKDLRKRLEDKTKVVTELKVELSQKDHLLELAHKNVEGDEVDKQSATASDSMDTVDNFHWSALGDANHSTPIKYQSSRQTRNVALSPIQLAPERSRSCSEARSKWVNHVRSKSLSSRAPKHRTRSSSPRKSVRAESDITRVSRELEETRMLLQFKAHELDTLKSAHTKRLDRLKGLQTNYNSVRQQLKTYEDIEPPGVQRKKSKHPKAKPRELRNEKSDSVWNELSRYKKENTSLRNQCANIQEELDIIRVQSSHDKATLHELQLELENNKHEMELQLGQFERDKKSFVLQKHEIDRLNDQNNLLSSMLEQMKKEITDLTNECEKHEIDKRSHKVELMALNHEVSQYRITVADLRHEVNRLERQILKGRKLLQDKLSTSTPRSTISSHQEKDYDAMGTGLGGENHEEGWEDLSALTEVSTSTSDTLGRDIVNLSRGNRKVSRSRTKFALKKNTKPRKTKRHSAKGHNHAMTRDFGINTDSNNTSMTTNSSQPATQNMATSPVHHPDHRTLVSRRKSDQTKTVTLQYQRQLRLSKQRVEQLHKQLKIIKENRAQTKKINSSLKGDNEQLRADLTSLSQRHKACRQTIQKLTGEVESLRLKCSDFEEKMLEQIETAKSREAETSSNTSQMEQKLEQDLKQMSLKIKASSVELNKQAVSMRTLKAENDSLMKELKTAHDKINRLERDNSQKKSLLDEQRNRINQSQRSNQQDSQTISDLTTQVKLKTDAADRIKTQLDSMKQRLNAVTKEKKQLDDKNYALIHDLQIKSVQLGKSQQKNTELESILTDLEKTAKEQMFSLANQTEAAIQSLKTSLSATESRLAAHEKFVKTLVMEVIFRVQKTRLKLEKSASTQKQSQLNDSLVKAQNIAKDILNISQSEMDDIMSQDSDHSNKASDDQRHDKKWSKKCERLVQKEDFASPLVQLIMAKLDDCYDSLSHQSRS